MPAKRPASYLLGLLLLILAAVVAWIYHALNSPVIQEAAIRRKAAVSASQPPVDSVQPSTSGVGAAAPDVDPMHQSMADELHSEASTPLRDLEVVRDFISIYGRATGGNPIGDNADIMAALTGTQYPGQKGQFFPRGHRAIRNGQLVDRWGTPYWFHPNSASQMEIRSAGPDKQLFTEDDIVLNPSPQGLGASSEASP